MPLESCERILPVVKRDSIVKNGMEDFFTQTTEGRGQGVNRCLGGDGVCDSPVSGVHRRNYGYMHAHSRMKLEN